MKNYQDHISIDPKIMMGKPVIRGTRITVELILEALAAGRTELEILENYPSLTENSIRAALHFAAEICTHRMPVSSLPDEQATCICGG